MAPELPNMYANMATQVRSGLGFGPLEPIDITKVAKLSAVTCVYRPLDSEISGIFVRAGAAQVILINSAKTLGHQHYTLAHELYHALYDREVAGQPCYARSPKANRRERGADEFAAHLLMPGPGLYYYLAARSSDRKTSIVDVIYLEQLFGVSHQAMLNQLRRLKLIGPKEADQWESGIRQAARQWGYDDDLYRPTGHKAIETDYAEKARWALDRDLISFAKYEELLADAGLFDEATDGIGGDNDDVVD